MGANALEARAAAQAVLPSFQRSLHKYLRITRQQCRFSLEQVTQWLALALSFDLSPRLFLARFLQPGICTPIPPLHIPTFLRTHVLYPCIVQYISFHSVRRYLQSNRFHLFTVSSISSLLFTACSSLQCTCKSACIFTNTLQFQSYNYCSIHSYRYTLQRTI